MSRRDDLFDETPAPAPARGSKPAAKPQGRRAQAPAREHWEGTLVDAARPILEAVLLLNRAAQGFDPTYSEFRRTVGNSLEEFRLQARRMGILEEEVQSALYALVSFADEMVSASTWSGRDQWEGQSLEQERFKSSLAGQKFFENIDGLRDSQRQLLEIYYVCLMLGFEGGYRGDDQERRRELGARIEALRRRLGVPVPSWDRPVFDEAYKPPRSSERAQRAMGKIWLLLGGASGLAAIVVYFVYWLILLMKAGETASHLRGGG